MTTSQLELFLKLENALHALIEKKAKSNFERNTENVRTAFAETVSALKNGEQNGHCSFKFWALETYKVTMDICKILNNFLEMKKIIIFRHDFYKNNLDYFPPGNATKGYLQVHFIWTLDRKANSRNGQNAMALLKTSPLISVEEALIRQKIPPKHARLIARSFWTRPKMSLQLWTRLHFESYCGEEEDALEESVRVLEPISITNRCHLFLAIEAAFMSDVIYDMPDQSVLDVLHDTFSETISAIQNGRNRGICILKFQTNQRNLHHKFDRVLDDLKITSILSATHEWTNKKTIIFKLIWNFNRPVNRQRGENALILMRNHDMSLSEALTRQGILLEDAEDISACFWNKKHNQANCMLPTFVERYFMKSKLC